MAPRSTRTTLLRVGLALLGALALALVLIALVLPVVGAEQRPARPWTDWTAPGATSRTCKVTLFPLRYTVTRLKITPNEAVLKQPFFYAERSRSRCAPGASSAACSAGTVEGDRVKLVLEQPKPGGDGRMPSLAKLIPMKAVAERLQLHDSEVLYAWVREKGRPSLWSHGIEATLENLGSRPGLAEGPMELAAAGTIAAKGKARVTVSARPHAERLTFSATASLDGFDPAQMNAYLSATKGVTLTSGVFATRMQFRCEAGRLEGVVRPRAAGQRAPGQSGTSEAQ